MLKAYDIMTQALATCAPEATHWSPSLASRVTSMEIELFKFLP